MQWKIEPNESLFPLLILHHFYPLYASVMFCIQFCVTWREDVEERLPDWHSASDAALNKR